jgi:hypothetical protein
MLGFFINNGYGNTSNNSGCYSCIGGIEMKSTLQGILLVVGLWLLAGSKYAYALDDFDLYKYGPDDTIEVTRTDFIVKLVLYKTRDRLNNAFEEATKDSLPEGAGVRGFALVRDDQDVCFVHIIPAEIWDDREAMAIMGHEIYHCALADHNDVINETAETDKEVDEKQSIGEVDIEDLYAEDRRLELEWLKDDYEDMGIKID